MGTPQFAQYHLQSLIDDRRFEVVGVMTQPDRKSGRKMQLQPCPVKQLALQHGLPVVSPEKVNTEEVFEALAEWNADAAVVVAFGQILPQRFLDLYPQRVVNVHASLLPRWRGAAPIQRAIMAGDPETGVALQVMVKQLDAGDVIGVRKILITDDMSAVELHDALMPLGAELLHEEFVDYLEGQLIPTSQDETLVTYASKIDKSEGLIDWTHSAKDISNKIRGLQLGPGTFTFTQGKMLKIHKAVIGSDETRSHHGQVLAVGSDGILIGCGHGTLKVLQVQPESRARMNVADYLKGYTVNVGDQWGEQ